MRHEEGVGNRKWGYAIGVATGTGSKTTRFWPT